MQFQNIDKNNAEGQEIAPLLYIQVVRRVAHANAL